jgi:hypothetical protein
MSKGLLTIGMVGTNIKVKFGATLTLSTAWRIITLLHDGAGENLDDEASFDDLIIELFDNHTVYVPSLSRTTDTDTTPACKA